MLPKNRTAAQEIFELGKRSELVISLAVQTSMYGVHATQISAWKKQALEELGQVFSSRRSSAVREQEDLTATLYQQIGQLKVELDWLKKKASSWQ